VTVDVQQDGQQIAPLVPVLIDDSRHRGLVRGMGVGRAGQGLRVRQLGLVADGADFQTDPAAGAGLGFHIAGPAAQGGGEAPRIAVNALQFRQGKDFDVGVPADLDQLGTDNSHGAVVGGEGLVDLRHGAADGRPLLHQTDIIARVGQIQGGLHAGDAASHHHDGAQDVFAHLLLLSTPY